MRIDKKIICSLVFVLITWTSHATQLMWETDKKIVNQLVARGKPQRAIEYLGKKVIENESKLSNPDKRNIAIEIFIVSTENNLIKQGAKWLQIIYESLLKSEGEAGLNIYWSRQLLLIAYRELHDYQHAVELAKLSVIHAPDNSKKLMACLNLALVYVNMGANELSIHAYQDAGKIANKMNQDGKFNKELSTIYNNIGIAYGKLHDRPNEIKYLKASLAIGDPKKSGYYHALHNLGVCYAEVKDFKQAKPYFDKVAAFYDRNNLIDDYAVNTQILLGKIAKDQHDAQLTINHYQHAYDLSVRAKLGKKQMEALNQLGSEYINQKKFTLAETTFNKAVKLAGTLSNEDGLPKTYFNLGKLSLYLNKISQAENYFQKGEVLITTQDSPNHSQQAMFLSHTGYAFYHQKRYDQAEKYYQRAYDLLANNQQNQYQLSDLLVSWANVKMRRKQFNLAESMLNQSLTIKKQVVGENHRSVANLYNDMGYLYGLQHKLDAAITYYKKAVYIAKKTLDPDNPYIKLYRHNLRMVQYEYSLGRVFHRRAFRH